MLAEARRDLVRILTGEAAGPCGKELWAAALEEQVAATVAMKVAGPVDEAWAVEQQLQHEARLYWLRKILDRLPEVVNLKGPVFGERYYQPPYGRPSLDLDLALAPGDVPAAVRELEKLGYAAERTLFVAMDQHVTLLHEMAPTVELHYRLISEFGASQEVKGFLARARTIEIPRLGMVKVPAVEDEFVFLCAHAAKHGFRRLRWMYDLFLLVERTELDGELVWKRAGEMRVRALLALAVVVLRRDWGMPLSGIPIPQARLDKAARILPRFTEVQPPALTKRELVRKYAKSMAACDNLWSRLRLWWRLGASFLQRVAKERVQ